MVRFLPAVSAKSCPSVPIRTLAPISAEPEGGAFFFVRAANVSIMRTTHISLTVTDLATALRVA